MEERPVKKHIEFPADLTAQQWQLVAMGLATAFQVVANAYERVLGPNRIQELVDLKRELVQGALNAEISGVDMSTEAEPAVIKLVADLLDGVIPDEKR